MSGDAFGRMRVGLLGTGPWAEMTQAPALRDHPGVDLVGVWGRRPEAAAECAERFGTRAYDDPDTLFADCEAVAVALPPDVQAPLAARAAAAGCHLLLDKPVATTVAEARAVVTAVERAGVSSVVFFTLRFLQHGSRWVEEAAATGGWYLGRADWIAGLFGGSLDSPFAASPWRREKGGLWDVGPHALSMLLPVLGDAVDLQRLSATRGADDTVHFALRHAGGASSTVTATLTAPGPATGERVEVRGTAGVSTLPPGVDGDGPVPAFGRAVDALLTAARGGPSHPCDVRFGLHVTEILAAVETAAGPRRT